jgi:predicted house-cleaning NTP pyrophosphatase (Maf/HAM1 superfamily)
MKLILASQSPGRAALLKGTGYRFRQIPSRVHEPGPMAGAPLERHVLELAILKAMTVARRHPDAIVIGADTALIHGRQIIGKPGSLASACRMLEQLGGRVCRTGFNLCRHCRAYRWRPGYRHWPSDAITRKDPVASHETITFFTKITPIS